MLVDRERRFDDFEEVARRRIPERRRVRSFELDWVKLAKVEVEVGMSGGGGVNVLIG